ncbi:Importin-13 [Homalodisca vitripennis]|nr:Importin-13 [Homalodisca vitripennis]
MKVMKSWSEVPVEQYDDLKKRLLQAIINYASGPKIVLNRLCIALSAFILNTTPKHWPGAIPELLSTFQPANMPSIPPDKALWILLEVLTVIPEEGNTPWFLNTFTAGDEHARHAKVARRAVDEGARHMTAAFILPQCELSSCLGRL